LEEVIPYTVASKHGSYITNILLYLALLIFEEVPLYPSGRSKQDVNQHNGMVKGQKCRMIIRSNQELSYGTAKIQILLQHLCVADIMFLPK
jgi:hypothetical protein